MRDPRIPPFEPFFQSARTMQPGPCQPGPRSRPLRCARASQASRVLGFVNAPALWPWGLAEVGDLSIDVAPTGRRAT